MNPLRSTDKIQRIGIMLLHTRSNSQHVGVEDDILRQETHLVNQQPVGPFCYFYPALIRGSLSLFVEAHHHHGSTHALHVACMTQKHLLTLFQGDGVHDTLALHTLQASHNHIPLTGINHHRHTGNIRLRSYQVQEMHHLCLRIQQSVIHIDIDDHGTILHLFACYLQSLLVALLLNQSQELTGTGHVTAFAHIDERSLAGIQEFQARQP